MSLFGIQVSIYLLAGVPALSLIPIMIWIEVYRYQLRIAATRLDAKRPGWFSAVVGLVSCFLALIGATIALLALIAGVTDTQGEMDYLLLLTLCTLSVTKGVPFLVARFLPPDADQATRDRGRKKISELWRPLPWWERAVYALAVLLLSLGVLANELSLHAWDHPFAWGEWGTWARLLHISALLLAAGFPFGVAAFCLAMRRWWPDTWRDFRRY